MVHLQPRSWPEQTRLMPSFVYDRSNVYNPPVGTDTETTTLRSVEPIWGYGSLVFQRKKGCTDAVCVSVQPRTSVSLTGIGPV